MPDDGFARLEATLRTIDERLTRIEADLAALRKPKRKRSIFKTREERDAWFAHSEENRRHLEERLEKLRAEFAAKQKPA